MSDAELREREVEFEEVKVLHSDGSYITFQDVVNLEVQEHLTVIDCLIMGRPYKSIFPHANMKRLVICYPTPDPESHEMYVVRDGDGDLQDAV